MTISTILLIVALVLFILSAVGAASGRFNLASAGWVFVTLSWLITRVVIVFCALSFMGCSTFPPIKGKLCYNDKQGNAVCVGSDGQSIIIEGGIEGYSK